MKKLCVGLCGLAVLLALHCAVEAQGTRVKGAPRSKSADRPKPSAKAKANSLRKRSARPKRLIHPRGVFGPRAAVGSQLSYSALAVNAEPGTRLLDFDKQPLRASQIRVWATRVAWRDRPSGTLITSPSGAGGSASTDYAYPGFHFDGVVINQPGGITQNIESTTRDGAQVFQVSNGADLITNVNDLRGFYGVNSGDFEITVEILQQ